MMATTELDKVPATIQSRSQVFELKTIGARSRLPSQLRKIADAEQIEVDDAALMLVARAGDGSMRDAQSAFDQVIAFAGRTITEDDVSTVLGLVRRELLIEIADAVASEDGAAVFELAGRAVESGYDLRLVVRELSRLMRDLLVIGIDPARVGDPEIAAESERERLQALARELLRRRSDARVRRADEGGGRHPGVDAAALSARDGAAAAGFTCASSCRCPSCIDGPREGRRAADGFGARVAPKRPRRAGTADALDNRGNRASRSRTGRSRSRRWRAAGSAPAPPPQALTGPALKEAFLAEIQKLKKFFYGTVVAQAQHRLRAGSRRVHVSRPQHRALREQLGPDARVARRGREPAVRAQDVGDRR